MKTTIVAAAAIIIGAAILIILFYWIPRMRNKAENELRRLEREHWNYVQKKTEKKSETKNYYSKELAGISKAKDKEKKLPEAAKIITRQRRQGTTIEDCTRTLHASGFSEKEIEDILEQSDKMM
ncbi:MAG: hypothetical protein AB1467_04065 [Candidatus Diapherotrites archaeon]